MTSRIWQQRWLHDDGGMGKFLRWITLLNFQVPTLTDVVFVRGVAGFYDTPTVDLLLVGAGYMDEKFAYLFDGNPLGYPSEELRRLQNPDAKPGQATVTSGPAQYSVDGVKVRWRETYRSAAGFFHQQFEPYSKPEQPNSVRIVMWFSS